MPQLKTVLVAPGFGDTEETGKHLPLFEALGGLGVVPVFVPLDWENGTLTDWTDCFAREFGRYDPRTTGLGGFSLGAKAAFVAAATSGQEPCHLLLMSLSLFFAEDLHRQAESRGRFGEKRWAAFAKYRFESLAPAVTCPTLVVAGTEEVPEIKYSADRAIRLIPGARRVDAPGCKHDYADPRYVAAVTTGLQAMCAA